jgi:hypothetical protein
MAIDRFIGELPPEDQIILRMRFWNAAKVPDIARQLFLEQKKVYKRLDKLCAQMRDALQGVGVDRETVSDLLAHPVRDLGFESMPERMQSSPPSKHST